ncbi:hypothetical protein DRP53_06675 [candidate division WOR-3 bacterium]|uniref:Glycosyltransferase 2-like domain-containing protein n=1 Tax=candidate division WOR-3 bacterium TaxID=2052148 RepID=A0A660SH61_UNCW3|nr:MAG: hypothetical protein DRP53_06675 [candidate division WOR-3 bacterium]
MIEAVVINYNSGELILRCLESLTRYGIPYLLIDNNSTDGSLESIKRKFPASRIIENRKNLGFARAVNQGVRASKAPYILLINPDAELISGVESIISFLNGHQKAAVVGGLVLNPDRTRQPSCRGIPTLWNFPFGRTSTLTRLFPQNPLSRSMLLPDFDYRSLQKVPAVCGSFMFIRRSVFEALGGMDESFFLYVEDIDLCKRVWEAGYEVWFHPGSSCIHYLGESHRNNIIRSRIHHIRSMLYFLKKHYHPDQLLSTLLYLGAGLSTIYFMGWFPLKRKVRW